MSARDERELLRFASLVSARYHTVRAPASFRAQLRRSLLAAPVAFASVRASPFGRLSLRQLLALIFVLALLATAGGGAAAAISLPGDPAFGLKRGVEQVQVALAPDEIARLEALLTQAEARLGDLETLAARRSSAVRAGLDEYVAASARVGEELTRVAALPASAHRDSALARASTASVDHLVHLQTLAMRLPDSSQQGIRRAIEVQQTVHGRSGNPPGRGGSEEVVPTLPIAPSSSTPANERRRSNEPATPPRGRTRKRTSRPAVVGKNFRPRTFETFGSDMRAAVPRLGERRDILA